MTLAEKLKQAGVTNRALAQECGEHEGTTSKRLSGTKPLTPQLIAAANRLIRRTQLQKIAEGERLRQELLGK